MHTIKKRLRKGKTVKRMFANNADNYLSTHLPPATPKKLPQDKIEKIDDILKKFEEIIANLLRILTKSEREKG